MGVKQHHVKNYSLFVDRGQSFARQPLTMDEFQVLFKTAVDLSIPVEVSYFEQTSTLHIMPVYKHYNDFIADTLGEGYKFKFNSYAI